MNKKHAQYGPSSLDNLARCVRFKFIESDDLEAAATEGTLLHEALETGNLAGLNEEQAQVVTTIRDYINSLMAGNGGPDKWTRYDEMKVSLADLTFGTADCVLINTEAQIAHVIDAKFTRVPAEHNFQVTTYGAAIAEKYPDLETIITHVVIPRQGVIDKRSYDAPILVSEVRRSIEELYERIEDPFTPPTMHEDICKRCARASRCPAMGALVVSAAPKLGLPLPSAFAPNALVSTKDRAIAQVLAEALITWADQIKKNNTEFVKSGAEIPGYRMVSRSTGLRIPAELTSWAFKVLETQGGISRDTLESCSRITLGALTKTLAEERGLPVGEVKEMIQNLLSEIAVEDHTTYLQKAKRQSNEALLQQLL